jgi:hypothetical protein
VLSGASGIEVTIDELHPDYKFCDAQAEVITDQHGLLQLFRIVPKCAGLPAFAARMGHDDQNAVDIDLLGDNAQSKLFRAQATGYVGHHTDRLAASRRRLGSKSKFPQLGAYWAVRS